MKTTLKSILTILFCTASILLAHSADKPNVIVVLADDVGTGDISHYRRMHSNNIIVETPNIDKLAESGVVFTQAHTPAALCAPSRYGIMTGNSCYRSRSPWGVWGSYELSPVKDTDLTLGKMMQSVGYHTSFFGKWHLGGDYYRLSIPTEIYRAPRSDHETDVDITQIIDGPQQKGFNYSFTLPAGIQDMPYAMYENGQMVPIADDSEVTFITQAMMDRLNVKLDKEEGLGDSNWDPHLMGPILANKAVDYINAHANQDDPFFMYYCSQAVHLPHTPPDSLDGFKIKGSTPSPHLDMVKEMDVQMGMIVKALKAKGVYENTIFIFTSDNGGLNITETRNSGHQSNSIYRGNKNTRFEGGHRVPFIVSWPEGFESHQTNAPVLAIDIMATLSDLTGAPIGEGQALDSYNILPLLKQDTAATTHAFLITQGGTSKELIFIEDGWKLIIQTDKDGVLRDPIALYDLNTNVQENESGNYINSADHKSRIDAMLEKYNQIRDSKVPTNDMGTGMNDSIPDEEVFEESVDFMAAPEDHPYGAMEYKAFIQYAANEARDISLEIRTPAPENNFVKNVQLTYPKGEYDTTIVIPLDAPLAVGNNYNLSLAIKPIGTNWKSNIDKATAMFNVVDVSEMGQHITSNVHSNIYPTPANGALFVSYKGHSAILSIHNMSGQLCFEENLLGGEAKINLNGYLYKGTYLATISNMHGSTTHKIILE